MQVYPFPIILGEVVEVVWVVVPLGVAFLVAALLVVLQADEAAVPHPGV